MADLVKLAPFILLGFFMLFTVKDLIVGQFNNEATDKEIPNMNLGPGKYLGPTLKILYCHSCGYKNVFEHYTEIISKKYPDIIVQGSNYPPPGLNYMLAKLIFLSKIFILAAILTGSNLPRFLERFASTWSWCISNKLYSCAMTFVICNIIEGQLMSTGAFEIIFNDVPIWSKIETGRVPQPPELFQIIENQLRFQGYTFASKPEIPY